jgi:hypothetical protein
MQLHPNSSCSLTYTSSHLPLSPLTSYKKMAKKKSFALRIDEDLMEAIEQWAADEFRSANGQIEWMLYQMLKQSGRLKRKINEPENEQITDKEENEPN